MEDRQARIEHREWMRRTAKGMPALAARVFALRDKAYPGHGFHWSLERSLGKAIAAVNDYEADVWHGKDAIANRMIDQVCIEALFETVAKAEQYVQLVSPTAQEGTDA